MNRSSQSSRAGESGAPDTRSRGDWSLPESSAGSSPVSSQGVRVAVWVLRFVVVAQCVGLALPAVLGRDVTVINSYLWHHLEWSDEAATQFDLIASWSVIVLGVVTLLLPMWPILLLIGIWFALTAVATWYMDSGRFSNIAVFAHAVRFVVPFGLILLQHWPQRFAVSPRRVSIATFLLACGIGSTFIAHGYEAFCLHAKFTDYIIVAGNRFLSVEVTQDDAEWLLRLIGVVDVVVGVCIVACSPRLLRRKVNVPTSKGRKPSRRVMPWASRVRVGIVTVFAIAWLNTFREPAGGVMRLADWSAETMGTRVEPWVWNHVAALLGGVVAAWLVAHWRLLTLWLAVWGIVTAFSRVVYADWIAIDQALVRFANGGAALALFVYWNFLSKRADQPRQSTRATSRR